MSTNENLLTVTVGRSTTVHYADSVEGFRPFTICGAESAFRNGTTVKTVAAEVTCKRCIKKAS
jgi:hypothetical protein